MGAILSMVSGFGALKTLLIAGAFAVGSALLLTVLRDAREVGALRAESARLADANETSLESLDRLRDAHTAQNEALSDAEEARSRARMEADTARAQLETWERGGDDCPQSCRVWIPHGTEGTEQ